MTSIALLPRRLAAVLVCLGGLQATASAAEAEPALLPIRSGDLLGLIDARGRVVLPAEFEELKIGDPLILVRKARRTAYFDFQGRMVVPPQDAWSQPFSAGLVPAVGKDPQGKSRWGYADPQGRWSLPPAWDDAQPFTDGLAVVGLADAWGALKYGAIDRTGRLVVPAVHDKLLRPGGGLVRSESRERTHRVFNAQGRDITPEGVDFVGIAADGMVRIWSGRKQGFMTVAGELAVPPRYEQASDFREGRARIWVDGKFGFIDRTGRIAVPARWDSAEDFSDGLAQVKADGQARFIDPQGQVVLEPKADRVWPFSEGLAVFKTGNRHGFIDKQGRTVIEAQYSYARAFQHGLAWVTTPGRPGGAYVGRDGQVVWRQDAN